MKKQLENHMRRLKEGDNSALDPIYALTSRSVYLLVLSILKNSDLAQDIMQDTYIRAVSNIDKYRAGTNAYAWLLRIARNLSYREYTKSARNVALDAFGELEGGDNQQMWAEDIDLNTALAALDTQQREVVTLYSLGYKHREIAKIIEKPLGTTLWLYSKAIKKLTTLL